MNEVIEKAIRKQLKKSEGELTKADLEKVTFLSLSDNHLTDVPKELEKLTKLETLFLTGNKLTEVKGLEKCTQLVRLNLYNSQLTVLPKGLEKLTQLKTLWLYANNLTDVKVLEKLTKLESLYLDDNPALTKAQIAQLQKALPKCEIRSNPKK